MIPKTLLAAPLLLGLCGSLALAADRQPTARDRYYEAAGDDSGGEPAWRGIRTSILLRRDHKDGAPDIREVAERFRFRDGDSFRLRVEANMDGYLYLFLRDSSGQMKLLFPEEAAKPGNRTVAYQARFVPGRRGAWFRFDNEPGIEQVFLFLASEPIAELEQLRKSNSAASLRQLERLIARNGPPTSLSFEEEDLEDGGDQGATFYVEKRTPRRTFLVRRFDLSHDAE
jgi:hypothetical protein